MGENETEIDFVNKRTPTVLVKCEGKHWGASTPRAGGSRHR